ncbi:hypothetical protein [Bacteroides sp. GM023]|uniref:hypothetical protein n=1 Tax=Bacteroides sp. GM023 TaxID=2723058 RepID=UPI00168AD75A|nr:hypothetical protein [Bacteroides sp. GM023]MBD3592304.1 hypothetical protein [Bacteroides sp. GM023]
MKKINLFALLTMLFSVTLFIGCRGSDDDVKDGVNGIANIDFDAEYRMVKCNGEIKVENFVPVDDDWYELRHREGTVFLDSEIVTQYRGIDAFDIYDGYWILKDSEAEIRESRILQIRNITPIQE